MMAHKHLHELLKEDQEPFQLKSYISEKRCQLKRVNNPGTTSQIKKRKPIITEKSSAATRRSFCKHACFLSFQDSPDVRKSPFLNFPSPIQKSPLRNGAVLLHVPAKTAALLFEAAMRVQNPKHSKEKMQMESFGFGILGSFLKKLKARNKNKKREIRNTMISSVNVEEDFKLVDVSCYCNNSRMSSAGWSDSNEEKSLDLESSCSSWSQDSLDEAFAAYEKQFCSTPLSPFRFTLHRSPSGNRTLDLLPPAASPSRKTEKKQEQAEGSNIVLEDEKEHCSPVSVLDTPFEVDDDDDGQECRHQDVYEDDYYDDGDNECNGKYAIVQKAKEQLLEKLRRFEKLIELDPIELEKRMLEMEEEECQDDEPDEPTWLGRETDNVDKLMLTEVLSQISLHSTWKFPTHMEKLVLDLISEQEKETNGFSENEVMVRSICKKLYSWEQVQPHTIDMMVQFDFGKEYDGWKKYEEQSREIAIEIEVAIFRFLVDELAEELCY